MRLWSLHPGLLDRQGLLASWREGLLAQKVLAGKTRGYRSHPELARFRAHPRPGAAIAAFLHGLADEADRRGYAFDRNRIREKARRAAPIPVSEGQLRFEEEHLAAKLRNRSPEFLVESDPRGRMKAHPLFSVVPGPVAAWERGIPTAAHRPAGPDAPGRNSDA